MTDRAARRAEHPDLRAVYRQPGNHRADTSTDSVDVHGAGRLTYGVFRYLFLVYNKSEGGDPAKLLFRDVPLVLSGLLYVGVVLFILSAAPPA